MSDTARRKLNVLFVCTGNSCRSQMAEGWARYLKSDSIEAFSAGVCPFTLSSRARRVMSEAGIDISDQTSKHIDDLAGITFDYVVILCGNAAALCPEFPAPTKVVHIPVADPSFLIAPEEQIMQSFRRTRDRIREIVEKMPESLKDYNEAKETEFL